MKDIRHEYLADRVILAASRCVYKQNHFVQRLLCPVGVASPDWIRSEF